MDPLESALAKINVERAKGNNVHVVTDDMSEESLRLLRFNKCTTVHLTREELEALNSKFDTD